MSSDVKVSSSCVVTLFSSTFRREKQTTPSKAFIPKRIRCMKMSPCLDINIRPARYEPLYSCIFIVERLGTI